MLQVKLRSLILTSVKIKATSDSKLNDSPETVQAANGPLTIIASHRRHFLNYGFNTSKPVKSGTMNSATFF